MVFKKVLFYSATILIPLVILGSIEIFLRTVPGYENDRLTVAVPNSTYQVVSSTYFNRYFNSFRPSISLTPFQAEKDKSTFRILALGGSSMAGYPYSHHYSIPSILELNLKKSFPDIQFELLNFSVTAFNSFGIVDIAKKIDQLDPDAIIVYTGHNEFYGALGSASTEGVVESGFLRRLYLNMYPLSMFQFGKKIISATPHPSHNDSSRSTTMSRMIRNSSIPLNSNLYRETIADFEKNLKELISISTESDVHLIISTVVSNLKEQPPLGDSQIASDFFKRGHDYYKKNNVDSARAMFISARDQDEVRFRASSDINRMIVNMRSNNHVTVIDTESTYKDICRSGIEDDSCFTDHLHPTLQGYGYIAKKFFEALVPLVTKGTSTGNPTPVAFITPQLDPLEELISEINLNVLKSAPPFTTDNSDPTQSLSSMLSELRRKSDPLSNASFQILTNSTHPATVYGTLSNINSVSYNPFFYYSWLQWDPLNEKIIPLGVEQLIKNQTIDPNIESLLLLCANRFNSDFCYNFLGALYVQQKEYNPATTFLKEFENKNPDDPSMLFNLAVLFYETGDMENALLYQKKYQRAVNQIDTEIEINSGNR